MVELSENAVTGFHAGLRNRGLCSRSIWYVHLLQGQSPERAAEKLERFLSAIPLEQSILLLLAPPSMALGEWVSDQRLIDDSHIFARGCRALAKQLGIHFADAGKWDVPLAHDGVHFTEQGHKAFAAGLLEVLK